MRGTAHLPIDERYLYEQMCPISRVNKYGIIVVSILILNLNTTTTSAFLDTTDVSNAAVDEGNATAEINHYIFDRSIHEQMKVGESYTVKVFVRNTGDSPGTFRVNLNTYKVTSGSKVFMSGIFPTGEFIFPRFDTIVMFLNKGESRRIEFNIVPIKPQIGDFEISADLYLIKSKEYLPGDIILVDNARKQIHIIAPQFNKQEQILIKIILISALIIIFYIIMFKKRKQY